MKKQYLILILLMLGIAAKSQQVEKVTSLNYYGSWGLNPTNLTVFKGKLYFFGTENVQYSDYLMMTPDGSAAGITVIKQIDSATVNSALNHLTVLNNLLIFNNQNQLWVSDGTAAGTKAIANLYFTTQNFIVMNNKIYFSAYTDFTYPVKDQLYESDGTASGTKLVKTINPTGGSAISQMYMYNGKIYFSAYDGVGSYNVPWVTDGTTAGTIKLKEIAAQYGANASFFTPFNGKVYFNAIDNSSNAQLWVTDGTPAGTSKITNINPTGALGLNPNSFIVYNSKLYFNGYDIGAFFQLWSTDGTTTGTVKVKTDYTQRTYSGFALGPMAVYNNKLYLNGYDSLSKTTQLWVTDGTKTGIKEVTKSSKNFNPQKLYTFQNKLIMTGFDTLSNREEIFFSDGTAAGTIRPTPPSTVESLPFYPWKAWVPFNNAVYYTACYTFWSDYQLCRYVDMPSTGISELPKQNLNVYPNPTSSFLNVVIPNAITNAEIEVYNSTGTLISKQTATNALNTVDLSIQSPGLYLLKVICNNRVIDSQKIIKQ